MIKPFEECLSACMVKVVVVVVVGVDVEVVAKSVVLASARVVIIIVVVMTVVVLIIIVVVIAVAPSSRRPCPPRQTPLFSNTPRSCGTATPCKCREHTARKEDGRKRLANWAAQSMILDTIHSI